MSCSVINWIPVLARQEVIKILMNSLKYLQEDGMSIYAYVIMQDHLHLIAQSHQLDKDIARFKSFTARQIIDYLKNNNEKELLSKFAFFKKSHKKDREYQFWQEGVHPEMILNEQMMMEKIAYIHQNPVKSGAVVKAENWIYSSAGNYAGNEGPLIVSKGWI